MLFRPLQRVSRLFAAHFMRSNYFQKHAASQYSTDSSNVVQLTFEWLCNGVRKTVPANVGDTLLEVILDNELDIDGFGACGGELACSTCHLILSDDIYNKLPNPPSEEETDLLDLAPVITDTSRLGCQVIVSDEMDGAVIKIPEFL
ncbi:Adrenodoxin, mitochondrial [Echinococcus granulosus]|uniref:Adrenodoxin mitochondrial n=1 Tax=Echinococcus granulosus TaxID=6210 RepID=A0A068X1N9_ECHGR|nr:Adrenodoxin, mitochondrial [Echinococcus granulosus]CDS23888.1 Adrenodoxin mitochondrial [Echinococcus granulosus]